MKKYFLILIIGFSFATATAQEVFDAVRLAQTNNNGTARFQAMSGAFGSLGGDFSAIDSNPAGSVIFNNNQWSASLSSNNIKNDTNYFNNKTSEKNASVDLNQAGAVFIFTNTDKKSGWSKFALSLNYNNIGNFNNEIFSAGTNQNSVANYFLSYANTNATQGGIKLGFIRSNNYDQLNFADQQAWLGFESYIINPEFPADANNSNYLNGVRPGGNYRQQNSFVTKGYNGKLNFNAAAQYGKFLSFGLNLNSHFTDYKQSTSFFESNSNPIDGSEKVKEIRFNNDIHTIGNGFSLQLGMIAKITNEFRIGLAYDSPTWYELTDELTQNLTAVSSSTFGVLSPDVVNPNTINFYDPYRIQTPGKISYGMSYVFGKKGIISIDQEYKDYSATTFKPENEFTRVNSNISNSLTGAFTTKIGAEYRIKNLSLRGGFRAEQSPYKNKKVMGDLYGISSGIGYSWGDTKLDVSYVYSKINMQNQFFAQGLTDYSTSTAINNNVTFTLAFEL